MPPNRIEAKARLRMKNQLTLPTPIVNALGAGQGDVLVFEADPAEPGTVVMRRMLRSYAGALPGVYGTTRDVVEFVRVEHESWNS